MPLMNQQGNGHLFIQPVQPVGWLNGDLWIDTSGATYVVNVNNTGVAVGLFSSATSITVAGITDTLENFIIMR